MHDPSLIERTRFWLADHQAAVGLSLASVLIVCLGGAFFGSSSTVEPVTGAIERIGLQETETGSYPVAYVRLTDRAVVVSLPRTNNCVVGGPIHLLRRKQFWGSWFGPARSMCS